MHDCVVQVAIVIDQNARSSVFRSSLHGNREIFLQMFSLDRLKLCYLIPKELVAGHYEEVRSMSNLLADA